MKKINTRKRNKHGASSIFLAIIMSALILVECTFVAFVWNLDYALSVNTALKNEVETILADYNRQLYSVYGIYAFAIEGVDGECFEKALEINGLTCESELFVSGKQRFTCEDLKKAIDSYFWYRGTGFTMKMLVQQYADMIRELDKNGVLNEVGQFMKSPAAGYVSKIITGSDKAEDWIKKAEDTLNIDELVEEANEIDSLSEDYKNAIKDIGLDIDVDPANWQLFLNTLSRMEGLNSLLTDNSPEALTKCNVSFYCAYNFDCYFRPSGDASINGTGFGSIHSKKSPDCEYIITGHEGMTGVYELLFFDIHIMIASCVLKDYADEKFRNTMYVIAQIVSEIILAVSEGTVDINPKIIRAGLIFFCATLQATKDLNAIMYGGRAVIFEYEGNKLVTWNYRDFLYLYCLCTSMDKLLERSHKVLERDYGDLYKGLTLEADFRGNTYSVTKSYQLYE